MKRCKALLVVLLTLLPLTCWAQVNSNSYQPEEILYYKSVVTVNPDTSITVQETIKVQASGNQIKHGIYRDFPTRYSSLFGGDVQIGFKVISVTRDGQPEPYSVTDQNNGVRTYIGDHSYLLTPGVHTYVLTYQTDRQLGFFKDHDELYWNATGNQWRFPILKATAVVILPSKIPSNKLKPEAYTGPQGEKGKDYSAKIDKNGHAVFTATRVLSPGEGLTVVVSWPKGYFKEPSKAESFHLWIQQSRVSLIALLGLIVVLLYYLVAWFMVGKDPQKGTIIPLYEPPADLSPAAIRYLTQMGYDNKALTAAIVNMGVKGYLTIKNDSGTYTLHRTKTDSVELSPEEKIIAQKLFKNDNSYTFDQDDYARIQKMVKDVSTSLSERYQSNFSTNTNYVVVGVVLSIVALALSIFNMSPQKMFTAGFFCLWLSIWSVGVAALLSRAIGSWKELASGGVINKLTTSINAGCTTVFVLPFLAGEVFGFWMLGKYASIIFAIVAILLGILAKVFFDLMKAPTVEGRKLMDQIDGFRMYLSVAEGDTLRAMAPVNKTPELFEKYLPYAMALNVETAWANQFADVLSQAGTEYRPSWYTGAGFGALGAAGFASSFGNSFGGTIASSSTPPGSSSGSGGGGSSGGGGGGGGGGGW